MKPARGRQLPPKATMRTSPRACGAATCPRARRPGRRRAEHQQSWCDAVRPGSSPEPWLPVPAAPGWCRSGGADHALRGSSRRRRGRFLQQCGQPARHRETWGREPRLQNRNHRSPTATRRHRGGGAATWSGFRTARSSHWTRTCRTPTNFRCQLEQHPRRRTWLRRRQVQPRCLRATGDRYGSRGGRGAPLRL